MRLCNSPVRISFVVGSPESGGESQLLLDYGAEIDGAVPTPAEVTQQVQEAASARGLGARFIPRENKRGSLSWTQIVRDANHADTLSEPATAIAAGVLPKEEGHILLEILNGNAYHLLNAAIESYRSGPETSPEETIRRDTWTIRYGSVEQATYSPPLLSIVAISEDGHAVMPENSP